MLSHFNSGSTPLAGQCECFSSSSDNLAVISVGEQGSYESRLERRGGQEHMGAKQNQMIMHIEERVLVEEY